MVTPCSLQGHVAGPAGVAAKDERAGNALYNSSVVVGPQGHIGTFRKVHLWN